MVITHLVKGQVKFSRNHGQNSPVININQHSTLDANNVVITDSTGSGSFAVQQTSVTMSDSLFSNNSDMVSQWVLIDVQQNSYFVVHNCTFVSGTVLN